MTRRVIDVDDAVWEKLGEMAVEAKLVYRGTPNRSAQIEALTFADHSHVRVVESSDALDKLREASTTISYDDAVSGLSHYQQNILLKQHPGQPAALERFYALVVSGGNQ